MIVTAHYNLDNLNQMNIDNVSNDNIGWAIAERFPTKEYLEIKKVCDQDEDPVNSLGTWQENEDYRDYIDMKAYNGAPIVFKLKIDDDCEGAELYTTNEIRLHAKSQEDIDYIRDIVEETTICKVEIVHQREDKPADDEPKQVYKFEHIFRAIVTRELSYKLPAGMTEDEARDYIENNQVSPVESETTKEEFLDEVEWNLLDSWDD